MPFGGGGGEVDCAGAVLAVANSGGTGCILRAGPVLHSSVHILDTDWKERKIYLCQ